MCRVAISSNHGLTIPTPTPAGAFIITLIIYWQGLAIIQDPRKKPLLCFAFCETRSEKKKTLDQSMRSSLFPLLLVACLIEESLQLRTGVAPTYIPTMRSKTSYEKSFHNAYVDVVKSIRIREAAQLKAFQRRTILTAEKDALLSVRTAEAAAADTQRNLNLALLADKATEYRKFTTEYVINTGLEPLWVNQQAVIADQDKTLTALTAKTTALDAHATQIKAHNDALDVEKRALWESLRQEELVEEREHRQATSQETQRDYETEDLAEHTMTSDDLNTINNKLNARNLAYDAQVPALQTSIDNAVATAKTKDVLLAKLNIEATAEDTHTAELTVSNAALQSYITKYTAANNLLTANNNALQTEVNTLTANRDTLKASLELKMRQRNAAKLQGDQYETLWWDMKQKKTRVDLEYQATRSTVNSACEPGRDALLSTNNALRATNQQLRDECF